MNDKNHYNYVTTYSGRKLNFKNPNPDDILLEDIVHNLSMICRYNGATKYHYSVLQHSVVLAAYVMDKTGDAEQALSALCHDFSEAYIVDIPRPIKPHLKGYKSIENKLMKVILEKFGVKKPSSFVMQCDTNIVANEAKNLFTYTPDWIADYDMLDIGDWEFQEADRDSVREVFMFAYNSLKNKISETVQ